jgi:hypothetical protein
MPTPCKNCRLAWPVRRCLVDTSSGRCSECLDRGLKSCDLVVLDAQFRRAREDRERLWKEADAAEEALMVARAKHYWVMKMLSQSDKNFQNLISREEASIAELELLEAEEREAFAASYWGGAAFRSPRSILSP